MALFQQVYTNKVLLDDTQLLTCCIENARPIDGHTEYVIKVQRGPLPDNSWRVNRRYNDFIQLHAVLSTSGLQLPLPPKKIIGNMDPEFIVQRQAALQNYLNIVLMNPILASSLYMKKFLDPENYIAPLHEIALQQVSLALRSDANFEVGKAIPDMGWRLRKHYYTVKNKQNLKQELLLAWVEFGPDKFLQDKDMIGVFKSLGNLKHHYIEPIIHLHVTENGALSIRNFYPDGTLRDILCNTKPKQAFIKKYGNPKQSKSLTTSEISTYAYQVLEALQFLHEKGLPYGHLHTGNIVLTPNGIKLLDIENGLLGLPAFYRPYVVQRRKLYAAPQVDIYAFGHVLYEMAFGQPLLEATFESLNLPHCDAKLKNVLEIILSHEALKQDLPTAAQLMKHPFFESAQQNASAIEKPYFKLNSHLKDALLEAINKTEARLKDEQKVARHQKRLIRVQEMMSSDEEMKKRRHKLKKEQKLAQERLSNQFCKNDTRNTNGKSSERSDSPTSTSTATSIGTLTPPSHSAPEMIHRSREVKEEFKPPPPPMPAMHAETTPNTQNTNDRASLLRSISSFNKTNLRKVARDNC
ncbi:unnamed protein product [Trichogramma brassicae]|uniref:PX domain-containing protein n=1 Tax=Trichogramma brassicae TaxID=86971 RepID=A0A6H5IX53_9HYME|nr:unnamed protein product [Trichogramma brassicae]